MIFVLKVLGVIFGFIAFAGLLYFLAYQYAKGMSR